MKTIRVLVVDDSAYNRRVLSDLLTAMPAVEVVGKAGDGNEALKLVTELKPDLVTLDLEMPRMDGFAFLRLLMARQPTPVVVVSGYSAKENVFRALELGALDFVAKPSRHVSSELAGIEEDLAAKVEMVRQLAPSVLDPRARSAMLANGPLTARLPQLSEQGDPAAPAPSTEVRRLVVVAASTGGPTALLELCSRLPTSKPIAVVIAQHMPERFTKPFAERLDRLGKMRVSEASDGQQVYAGHAYVAPGGRSIEVESQGGGFVLRIVTARAEDRYSPSANRLFESAARVAAERVVGVVLTGMGDDGATGALAIKKAGGLVFAEGAETAVVYGMPAAAVRAGAVDKSLPLGALVDHLAALLR